MNPRSSLVSWCFEPSQLLPKMLYDDTVKQIKQHYHSYSVSLQSTLSNTSPHKLIHPYECMSHNFVCLLRLLQTPVTYGCMSHNFICFLRLL